MTLTDPPYGVRYEGKTAARLKIANDELLGLQELVLAALTLAQEHCAPGGAAYLFHPDSAGVLFREAFTGAGFSLRQVLVWVKQQFVLGRQDYNWQHEPILYGWKRGAHRWHGGHKKSTLIDDDVDVALLSGDELVALVSEYRERDHTTVLREKRPQASISHPTMKPVRLCARLIIACENLGRHCCAMEIDPGYVRVIIDRWERHTGQTAKLEA